MTSEKVGPDREGEEKTAAADCCSPQGCAEMMSRCGQEMKGGCGAMMQGMMKRARSQPEPK